MGDGTRERLLYRINHLKGGGYIMEASSSQENPSNQATKMTVDSQPSFKDVTIFIFHVTDSLNSRTLTQNSPCQRVFILSYNLL